MLHFLSVVHIVSVMQFALLFLNLVFSFACIFFCSFYIFCVSSASIGEINVFIYHKSYSTEVKNAVTDGMATVAMAVYEINSLIPNRYKYVNQKLTARQTVKKTERYVDIK